MICSVSMKATFMNYRPASPFPRFKCCADKGTRNHIPLYFGIFPQTIQTADPTFSDGSFSNQNPQKSR